MRSSRCSGRTPIALVWAGIPSPGIVGIEAAVTAFERLVRTSDREWDPRHWAMLKSEFRNLLRRAERGALIPVTHVKDIDRGASEFVFEILHNFNVIERGLDDERVSKKVKVRFYVSEPPAHPNAILGLHVHEKEIIPGDHSEENRLQNVEIDVAISYYELGRSTSWGL